MLNNNLLKYTFTVFTPTYNRQKTLKRVYESLVRQTYRDFEWIIIDDGSTDNTILLVNEWIKQKQFKIRYYIQNNMHKFYCIIKAVELSNGRFFIVADSDDAFVPNTLEILNKAYLEIPEKKKVIFSGVWCRCVDQVGNEIGDKFPTSPYDSNVPKVYLKDGITGEKWGFTKTKLLKSLSFSEKYFNNGYIPEGVIWNKLADMGYKTRFIDNCLRVYFIGESGDSIMQNRNIRKNSFGVIEYSLLLFNDYGKYFWGNIRLFIINMILYICCSRFQNVGVVKQIQRIEKKWFKILFIILIPLSFIVFIIRYREKK